MGASKIRYFSFFFQAAAGFLPRLVTLNEILK